MMDREEVDAVVINIMINDGPDRHIDGHGIITDFIMALLSERGRGWVVDYQRQVAERKAERAREVEEWRRLMEVHSDES